MPQLGYFGTRTQNSSFEELLRVSFILAGQVGFEPTVALTTLVFKTSALNHSATTPYKIGGRGWIRTNGVSVVTVLQTAALAS